MTVELYFDMIGRKTAALIAGSIEAGAILATDDDEVISRYRRFGWALGLAFQLNDDLLGIWGLEQQTGKVADGRRPPQEDAAGAVRVRAREPGRPRAADRAVPRSPTRPRTTSSRSSRSSTGPAPRTTRAPRPSAGATPASPSWTASRPSTAPHASSCAGSSPRSSAPRGPARADAVARAGPVPRARRRRAARSAGNLSGMLSPGATFDLAEHRGRLRARCPAPRRRRLRGVASTRARGPVLAGARSSSSCCAPCSCWITFSSARDAILYALVPVLDRAAGDGAARGRARSREPYLGAPAAGS